jgi:hypothetical protein
VAKVYTGATRTWPTVHQSIFGAHIDWSTDTPAEFSAALTYNAAVYGDWAAFPLEAETVGYIDARVPLLAAQQSKMMLTLMPHSGLAAVTEAACDELTAKLLEWNAAGVSVIVRFGHEMNGSWYAWGQQPAAYVAKFVMVSGAVRDGGGTVLWAPNEASGYPYNGGAYSPPGGSADFIALDTNDSGTLTAADDPYAPFWPGPSHVDSVGLSLYHYGTWWPWDANDVPEAGTVAGMIEGNYHGGSMPNFYATYADGYDLPFMLAETATLFNVDIAPGAGELAVKQEWWTQVLDYAGSLPLLELIMWFEYAKPEGGLGGGGGDTNTVDWRLLANPTVRDAFLTDFEAFLS